VVALRKVDTAYFLCDERKFNSIEDATKELNRLRAMCVRLKKKQDEEISFLLGVSVTDSTFVGKIGYATRTRSNTVINVISDPKEPDIQADGSITATLKRSATLEKN